MKKIGFPYKVTAANALGQDTTFWVQQLEVEESDVGSEVCNYLGHSQKLRYTFRRSDVGRQTHRQFDNSGWTCWYFTERPANCSQPEVANG